MPDTVARSSRLDHQMALLHEADLLKSIDRANVLIDLSRVETVADHAWHVSLAALVLTDAAPWPADRDRVIAMLLIHDLVEIDAGDMPIDQPHDAVAHAAAEAAAALRLFGLLPADQGADMLALWTEFEAAQTPDARCAKALDYLMPVFQVVWANPPRPDHLAIAQQNLASGRAAYLAQDWPEAFAAAQFLANTPGATLDGPLAETLRFLAEADKLKSVFRATKLTGGTRPETSSEHSWHVALFALLLADYAPSGADAARIIHMLLIHDLVEIDAGDAPIFGDHDLAAIEAEERAAADRLFGLLPDHTGAPLRALWDEFEANASPDARFAKSLDRFSAPNQNLISHGGSWVEYEVRYHQMEARVGQKIAAGAPDLWDWLRPRAQDFFHKLGQF